MQLRPFEGQDAKYILSWIHDEPAFRRWSADRYQNYPAKPEDMIRMYEAAEGSDRFYPMTAVDETGVVGHILLRFTDEEKKNLRFGFVIVDDTRRGMGYGKQMLRLAIRYACDVLGAEKISLGVFENNTSAKYCYKSVGFQEIAAEQDEYYHVMGEDWKCIEMALAEEIC